MASHNESSLHPACSTTLPWSDRLSCSLSYSCHLLTEREMIAYGRSANEHRKYAV